ncbi:MAG: 23S rRNA (uracil(1939)-C(5))-methyltransferase RlmD [Acetivibrio ethanolgignens]
MHKIEKNDELELIIEDITAEGEGVGRADGLAFFVKDAITGDRVRVKVMKMKKSYGYARLLEILEPSPARAEPVCPVARQCGGCQLQHMKYKEQLKYKENKVRGCLERIGGLHLPEAVFEPIIGMEEPFYYRNKAQFPVGRNKEGHLVTGFYASRTHSIIDTSHCYIQAKANEQLLNEVWAFLEEEHIEPYNEETHQGLVRHILTRVGFVTGEIMVCLIINGEELPASEKLVERLKKIEGMTSICLNINREKTNVILGNQVKVLWGQGYITDYIGDIKYQISPLSFYQVNPVQTRHLYETALEYAGLTGNEVVWDLYCGIGTISLFLAQRAKQVYGVEIVPQAIADAKKNAEINSIENVEFFVGAAEEVLPQKYAQSNGAMRAQVIVVDPPRKGCDEKLLETIVQMEPERVVYVSCDPATLARDLKYLTEQGYEVKRVRPCDMFGNSVHVETCVLLTHKKCDDFSVKIEVPVKAL